MNIKQIRKILQENGIEEAKKEAEMLTEHFMGLNNIKLALNPDFEPSQKLLNAISMRCKTKCPIQHIIGQAYFMGEYFYVDENVLIPRDETEILVKKAIEIIKKNNFKNILDIGTGSGCIACTIAKNTNAQVLGIDISTKALQIAINNTSKLNLFNKAIFRKSDLFSNVHETFDLIISNPPYIPVSEKNNLQKEVLFEPDTALFAPDKNGIHFYKQIIEKSDKYLNKKGYIIFELGINQSELVKEIMIQNNFTDIEIEKDLSYIDRVISGRKL